MKDEIFRIIDANFNRSREGLRVCEDIARFILNSPKLTKELKSVRHKISDIMKDFFVTSHVKSKIEMTRETLSESRDVRGDVGRTSGLDKVTKRTSVADIFSANIERVKESFRVLEEFFKLIDKKASGKFSVLRYEVYDIEKKSIKKLSNLRNTG